MTKDKKFTVEEPDWNSQISAITEIEKDYYLEVYQNGITGSLSYLAGFMISNSSDLWNILEKRYDEGGEIGESQYHKLWAFCEFDEFGFKISDDFPDSEIEFFTIWRKQIFKEQRELRKLKSK